MAKQAWQKNFEKFRKELEEAPMVVIKNTINRAMTEIVDTTPTLTGHMKFNWRGLLNQGTVTERDGVDPGGARTKAEFRVAIRTMRRGDKFYCLNPTSYLPYVEYGTSTIAARLWVTAVIAKLKRIAVEEKRKYEARRNG